MLHQYKKGEEEMKRVAKFPVVLAAMFASAIALLLPIAALAADRYPVKPVAIVVPYAAGSTTDLAGRVYAHALSKYLGQSVVIANRSNTVQGELEVGRERPDGYVLGMFGTGAFTLAKYLVPVYPDPANFDTVVRLIAEFRVLGVSEMSGFKTVKELMDYGQKNPKKLVVAINPGTTSHLDSVTIMKAMGIDGNYVPFKSGAERAVAVSGGRVQVTVDSIASLRPYADAKKMRILGVAAPQRVDLYPDIPTLREQGVNADSLNVIGIFAPKGVPEDVLATLEAAFEKAARDPELVDHLHKASQSPAFQNRRDFAKSFAEESIRIATVATEIGLARTKK
jgi:tripartite-type tricarboxylate transporter receptor subunit TctC